MTWKPNVTVAAIAEKNGKFLMVEEEIEGKTVFNQPAGHLDPGENLVNAVIRETLEETAWDFVPTSLVGVYLWENPENGLTFLRFGFYGECINHNENLGLDKEIIRTHWLTYDEIQAKGSQIRSPLVTQLIDDYLAGQRHPLSLLRDISILTNS
jgi:8-oxo-dGTP pyrophosphatase MutT (NUDIX family)